MPIWHKQLSSCSLAFLLFLGSCSSVAIRGYTRAFKWWILLDSFLLAFRSHRCQTKPRTDGIVYTRKITVKGQPELATSVRNQPVRRPVWPRKTSHSSSGQMNSQQKICVNTIQISVEHKFLLFKLCDLAPLEMQTICRGDLELQRRFAQRNDSKHPKGFQWNRFTDWKGFVLETVWNGSSEAFCMRIPVSGVGVWEAFFDETFTMKALAFGKKCLLNTSPSTAISVNAFPVKGSSHVNSLMATGCFKHHACSYGMVIAGGCR